MIGPRYPTEGVEARDGLHLNEDHFLPEIVDPETGAPLPPGCEGELVLTTLTREALPMIRYRTGDVTALDPSPCRCGRTTVRMARIKGRTDDMLIIKGVNVYPSQLEAALLTLPEAAPREVAALGAQVAERLRGHLGLSPEVSVVAPKTIPRSEGKAVRVVERR